MLNRYCNIAYATSDPVTAEKALDLLLASERKKREAEDPVECGKREEKKRITAEKAKATKAAKKKEIVSPQR